MLIEQNQPRTVFVILLGLLAIGCGGGCGNSGPQRAVVSGAVSYHGQPVADGEIRFSPNKGTTGPVTLASIVDGKYRTDAKGGVPIGTHKVQILAYLPDPLSKPEHKGTPAERPRKQYLPAKYNDQSELELVIEPDRGSIVKDFELAK